MARDLDRAISLILTDLNRGTEYSDRVREALCDAIALYTPKRLGFNTALISLSWSQSLYQAPPSNWIEIDYLRLSGSNYRDPLQSRSTLWLNDQDRASSPVTGPPRYYAMENRLIRVYPKPDADYQVAVSYHAELTEVSISADGNATNAWLNEGWGLIKAEASIDLIENYLGGDEMGRLPRLVQRREYWLEVLQDRANKEQGGDRLEAFL